MGNVACDEGMLQKLIDSGVCLLQVSVCQKLSMRIVGMVQI